MTNPTPLENRIDELRKKADFVAYNLGEGRKEKKTDWLRGKFFSSMWEVSFSGGKLHIESYGSLIGENHPGSYRTSVTYDGRIVLDVMDLNAAKATYVSESAWEKQLEDLVSIVKH